MPLFPVSPAKENELMQRMRQLGVRTEDLVETFVRSQGAGGQNVNKTATCVMLHHLPSGIKVKCQTTRSQGLNRFLARRILLDRLENQRLGLRSAEQQKVEKIRRQKRRRSRRARERLLADKRHHSEKKAQRAPLKPDGLSE